ncbi:helix-turn-helix domain-containing protein [Candidatus Woesearchaeota archaeon]|nr:helix-turn-helix domain-containing protein [Candidatus Woesearchaeota archaeon]
MSFEELKLFGLTGYEIKVYETLVKQGKSSARELFKIYNSAFNSYLS